MTVKYVLTIDDVQNKIGVIDLCPPWGSTQRSVRCDVSSEQILEFFFGCFLKNDELCSMREQQVISCFVDVFSIIYEIVIFSDKILILSAQSKLESLLQSSWLISSLYKWLQCLKFYLIENSFLLFLSKLDCRNFLKKGMQPVDNIFLTTVVLYLYDSGTRSWYIMNDNLGDDPSIISRQDMVTCGQDYNKAHCCADHCTFKQWIFASNHVWR